MNIKNIKIIIGPSKTLDPKNAVNDKRPQYLAKAKHLFQTYLKPLTLEQTIATYHVSPALGQKIYEMHQTHGQKLYYAIEVFQGLVFKQLKLEQYDKDWINEHLLIIDPLYGPLKPYDTIGLYRLDLNVKLPIDLKKYWKEAIEKELENAYVINLAAHEWTSWLDIDLHDAVLDSKIKQIKVARGKKLHELLLTKGQNNIK